MQSFSSMWSTVIVGGIIFVELNLFESIYQKIKLGMIKFAGQIEDYDIMPSEYCRSAAWIFLGLEVLIGVGVLFLPFTEFYLFGIITLGLIFLGVQISAVMRNMKISCGCYGNKSRLIGIKTMITPIVFIGVGFAGLCALLASREVFVLKNVSFDSLLIALTILITIETISIYDSH